MKNNNNAFIVWSWTDYISSYRFWGLTGYFVLFMLSNTMYQIMAPMVFNHTSNLPMQIISISFSIKSIGMVFGFILAWATIRTQKSYVLYLYSVLYLIGMVMNILSVANLSLIYSGAFISGLAVGAVTLMVPAFIAAGRGGSEAFIIAVGIITFFQTSGYVFAPMLYGLFAFYENLTGSGFLLFLLIPVLIGALLLLPVKPTLFYSAPPIKKVTAEPIIERDPMTVFLLIFVPFYFLYWLYRTHKEIRTLEHSEYSPILTPVAAVWSGLLIPIILPVILTSLNDRLNKIALHYNTDEQRRSWGIILWSLLFSPVAFALIQLRINHISRESAGKIRSDNAV